jgi:hypothetical protein
MARFFVGVDDTDFGDSIGTGALARELKVRLERRLGVTCTGITRHQLLVHPDIPYTSQNSSACLEIEGAVELGQVVQCARELLDFLEHPGADPGLCIFPVEQASAEISAFGRLAQTEVLRKAQAVQLASDSGVVLLELGGTGGGVIGALAACGLRASGSDGRFISLPGIRDMKDVATVAEILAATGVDRVVDERGTDVAAKQKISTRGWIRPNLVDFEARLLVREEDSRYRVVGKKEKDG